MPSGRDGVLPARNDRSRVWSAACPRAPNAATHRLGRTRGASLQKSPSIRRPERRVLPDKNVWPTFSVEELNSTVGQTFLSALLQQPVGRVACAPRSDLFSAPVQSHHQFSSA